MTAAEKQALRNRLAQAGNLEEQRRQRLQQARHVRLVRYLAEVYYRSAPPYPERAVAAAAVFSGLSLEKAKANLEKLAAELRRPLRMR
jgi:hypothetical protein